MSSDFTLTPADRPRRGRKPKKPNDVKRQPTPAKLDNGLRTRQELGAELWKAADILRGAVSPDKYDLYILPLLFYKRLSDVYLDEYSAALAKFGDERIARSEMYHRFNIPEGHLWEDIRRVSVNVGAQLNEILAEIARVDPRLDRVINRTDFNDTTALPEERLIKLIELFSQFNLANGFVSPDMLGDAYEYLLKKFNEVAPTRAGEFYTPREVVRVLVGCLKPEEGMEVYDPCVGSAGMLIESYYYVKRHGKDPKKLFLYGQELNDDTAAMAKMNVYLHDMEAEIVQGDTFVNPQFLVGDGLKQFDLVIANPMWNQDGFKQYMEDDQYGRFRYGVTTNSSADWGWIQHMLASLKPNGRMGIVLDQGALFRGGAEGSIRQGLLKDDLIECVVTLSEKLFYNTGAPGCLIFLNKNKPEERRGKVLFIYAAKSFEKLGNMNQLQSKHINRIIETFDGFEDFEKYSKVVGLDEIKENDYNLSVTRYVDIFDQPEPIDIQQVWNNIKEIEKRQEITINKLSQYLLELNVHTNSKDAFPLDWCTKQIGDLSNKIQYGYTASAETKKIGPKFLRITDITDGKIDWEKVPYCDCSINEIIKYSLKQNDILFARTGSTGSAILIKDIPEPAVFASYLIRLQLKKEALSDYFYQFLQSIYYWKQVEMLKVGAVQSGINASVLSSIKVPVPPIDEQQAIVEVLGTVDEIIHQINTLLTNYSHIKQSLSQILLSGNIRIKSVKDGLHRIQ